VYAFRIDYGRLVNDHRNRRRGDCGRRNPCLHLPQVAPDRDERRERGGEHGHAPQRTITIADQQLQIPWKDDYLRPLPDPLEVGKEKSYRFPGPGPEWQKMQRLSFW
jgi:hypothetical protein